MGEDEEGTKYWLEEPSFDCGHYWSLGYLHAFSNNRQPSRSIGIISHEHFDSKFLSGKGFADDYERFFKKSVLDKYEIYKLFELMECAYTLKKMAGICEKGAAWISENDCRDVLRDRDCYLEIVQKKLPAVISAICNLLGGKTKPEQFEKQAVYEE